MRRGRFFVVDSGLYAKSPLERWYVIDRKTRCVVVAARTREIARLLMYARVLQATETTMSLHDAYCEKGEY